MTNYITESTVEEATLSWFNELGYGVLHGPDIAPGEPDAERDGFGEVTLIDRLRNAIDALNPNIPNEARDEVNVVFVDATVDETRNDDSTSLFAFRHAVPPDGPQVRKSGGAVGGEPMFRSYASPAPLMILANFASDVSSSCDVSFCVDFRRVRVGVPQDDLGAFEAKLLSDLRSRGVSQLVGVPLRYLVRFRLDDPVGDVDPTMECRPI